MKAADGISISRGSDAAEHAAGSAYQATNKTTARVLRVLSAFLENPVGGYRVSELCRKLGIRKQTMIRALQTLVDEGYLCKSSQGAGYELGYRIVELGNFDQVEPELLEIAMPTMERMHVLTGETVALAVRMGDHTTTVEYLDGKWPLTGRVRKGHLMLLNIGPVSRTILAFLADPEIQDFLARHNPLPATTPYAITDPAALWEEIRATRARGYGEGLVWPGVTTIGFAIFGADNRPHGAVSLIGLTEDIQGERVQSAMETFAKLMEQLNAQTRLFHASAPIEIGL